MFIYKRIWSEPYRVWGLKWRPGTDRDRAVWTKSPGCFLDLPLRNPELNLKHSSIWIVGQVREVHHWNHFSLLLQHCLSCTDFWGEFSNIISVHLPRTPVITLSITNLIRLINNKQCRLSSVCRESCPSLNEMAWLYFLFIKINLFYLYYLNLLFKFIKQFMGTKCAVRCTLVCTWVRRTFTTMYCMYM